MDQFIAESKRRRIRKAARGGVALTYFEFGTLAALWLFARARLDALILEVGLGGRLDAVNVIDADVAVITGIGIDHVDYLGGTRESIGSAWITGQTTLMLDPGDPWPAGYKIADTWPKEP